MISIHRWGSLKSPKRSAANISGGDRMAIDVDAVLSDLDAARAEADGFVRGANALLWTDVGGSYVSRVAEHRDALMRRSGLIRDAQTAFKALVEDGYPATVSDGVSDDVKVAIKRGLADIQAVADAFEKATAPVPVEVPAEPVDLPVEEPVVDPVPASDEVVLGGA
jgi:hypothetical protein